MFFSGGGPGGPGGPGGWGPGGWGWGRPGPPPPPPGPGERYEINIFFVYIVNLVQDLLDVVLVLFHSTSPSKYDYFGF